MNYARNLTYSELQSAICAGQEGWCDNRLKEIVSGMNEEGFYEGYDFFDVLSNWHEKRYDSTVCEHFTNMGADIPSLDIVALHGIQVYDYLKTIASIGMKSATPDWLIEYIISNHVDNEWISICSEWEVRKED